jgi:hypothetical protein
LIYDGNSKHGGRKAIFRGKKAAKLRLHLHCQSVVAKMPVIVTVALLTLVSLADATATRKKTKLFLLRY